MPKWKTGDRVRIVAREATKEDRSTSSYFPHLAGLAGTVTHFYNPDEVAVKIDPESFTSTIGDVHKEAVKRMRNKLLRDIPEEQKKRLSKEERQFDANYVLLVHSDDLEKGPPEPKRVAPQEVEDEDEDFDPTSIKQGVLYDDPNVPSTGRPTSADIEAAEEQELRKRKR